VNEQANLRRAVQNLEWAHSIDLGDNIVTPGKFGPPNPWILQAFSDIDFAGKKVLDIGCWDGLWSFEAEKRGAREVYATDNISQRWGGDQATFSLAHKALNSQCKYYPGVSVYEVKKQLGISDFDIVVFCGVYYHLKNPLLAFARLREVMKEGGVIIVEGDVIDSWQESYARFCYHQWHQKDPSNWWVPTVPCLREWVECSFFDILKEYVGPRPRSTIKTLLKDGVQPLLGRRRAKRVIRYVLTARAVCRKDVNYRYADEDLRQFDLNDYERIEREAMERLRKSNLTVKLKQ
jgi:tRNA (mo5U34)-methyltransferase